MQQIIRVKLKQVRDGRAKFECDNISNPRSVYDAFKKLYQGADREILSVVCLDSQNKPTAFQVVTVGSLNTTRTRPADIFKIALLSNALGCILMHNHPSGCLDPSTEDVEFTKAVTRAGELLGIEVYDHVIITDEGYTSLRERGLL